MWTDLANETFQQQKELPWLIIDYDNTLSYEGGSNAPPVIYQEVIRECCGHEISFEKIREKRRELSQGNNYNSSEMLLAFISAYKPDHHFTKQQIAAMIEEKMANKPFNPKIVKEDFLQLKYNYRIGIISGNKHIAHKLPMIYAAYGVNIDGYVCPGPTTKPKPDPEMFYQFTQKYNIKNLDEIICYIGDDPIIDKEMAARCGIPFLLVNKDEKQINLNTLKEELNKFEEAKKDKYI